MTFDFFCKNLIVIINVFSMFHCIYFFFLLQSFLSIIICLHIYICHQIFLFDTNNLLTVVLFQVFLSNTNNLCIIIPKTFKKWYLIPPCLTLSIIRYVSRVKWSNPGKGVAPSPAPQCSSY